MINNHPRLNCMEYSMLDSRLYLDIVTFFNTQGLFDINYFA